MITERSAGAVIYRYWGVDPVFLLLNYPSGHWDFVKGKIERGETERQAAVREAAEESGISDLRFVGGFRRTIGYDFQHDGSHVRKSVVFFLAETRTSSVTLSEEHRDYAWMGYEMSRRRVTFDNARSVLAGARDHLLRTDS